MTARVLVRRATAVLTLAFVAACSSDNNTGPKGSFALVAPASAIAVPSGTGGSAIVAISRSGGFNGAVTFSVEGLPAGVTATVTPTIVTSNVTTVRVEYSVAGGTATGNKPFTIRGTSAGVADQTATVTLNVTSAQSFTTSLASNSISVKQNDSATVRASVVRLGGFAGVVNLTVSGLPAGVTVPFATVANDTATLTFRAALSATPGTTNVIVSGTNPATGIVSSQTIALTVLEIPGYRVTVNPIALAVPQGTSTTFSVSTERRVGYTGAITYAVSGALPTGVTASVTQIGDSAVVTLTAAANASIATTGSLTLTGTAPGIANRVVTVPVTAVTGIVTSGVGVPLAAGVNGTQTLYAIYVPTAASKIVFTTAGGTGDIDIYARGNTAPGTALSSATCTSEGANTNETCTITAPAAGIYFLRTLGFGAYSGAVLTITVTP